MATTSPTTTASIRASVRSAISSNSHTVPSSAAFASSSISWSTTRRTSIPGSRRRARSEIDISRLVHLVERSRPRQQGHGVSRVQKTTWTHDRVAKAWYSTASTISSRISTRPTRGPGGDPEDHGILDPARRVGLPHGRRAFVIGTKGAEVEHRRAVRDAAELPRIPAMAGGRRDHPRRSERPARTDMEYSGKTATACT